MGALETTSSTYPLWKTSPLLLPPHLEYKYIKIGRCGEVIWENGTVNRSLPDGCKSTTVNLIVDDGGFNRIQAGTFAYVEVASPLNANTEKEWTEKQAAQKTEAEDAAAKEAEAMAKAEKV